MVRLEDTEIEFKYSAHNIMPEKFIQFFDEETRNGLVCSVGMDHFYDHKLKPSVFLRHRQCKTTNQLTVKRKLNKSNNFIRIEHNVDLGKAVSHDLIAKFCEQLGFTYNMSLSKHSLVFKFVDHTVAYYTVGRTKGERYSFLEIELPEGKKWKNKKEALKALTRIENKYKILGIGASKRINKSLWEMFKI